MRLRLDAPPPWPAASVTRAFSDADELVLSLWLATFMGGVGADALRRFEGVRGVRRGRVYNAPPGFEGYVAWLESVMVQDISGQDIGLGGGGLLPLPVTAVAAKSREDKKICKDKGKGYLCDDDSEQRRLDG